MTIPTRSRRAAFWLGGTALALIFVLSDGSTAEAACTLSGSTVTCTDQDEDGFTGGNNLTVNIASGAFVQSFYDGNPSPFCFDFRAAVIVGQNAGITNAGDVLGRGNCGLGVMADTGLVLTNTGSIRTDSETAFAILALNNADITNSGVIRTVNTGSAAIISTSLGRFTNTATGLIDTTGADSPGLAVDNSNAITNAGRITTSGSGSFGIDAGNGNTITNSGIITTSGLVASGIRLRGTGNTVTNSGSISTLPSSIPRDGEDSIGMLSEAGGNTLTNSGTIAGDYAGVLLNAGDQLTNSGTISARAQAAASLPGGAVVLQGNASIVNTGTIRGVGTAAVRSQNGLLQLTNSGRIEGDVVMGNTGTGGAIALRTGSVITGTVFGSVNNNSILSLSGSGTLDNPVVNMGSLQQIADGAWTLGRRYDFQFVVMNAAGGTLTLTDGLRVNGTFFAQRGRLQGVGAITPINTGFTPSLTVTQVTVAPGLSAQAGSFLSIDGSADFQSASTLALDVSATANDRFIATGQLRSAANIALTYGGAPVRDGQTFAIIAANGIVNQSGQSCAGTVQEGAALGAGCFTVTDNAPYFIRSSLSVTGTTVTARVQRLPYASIARTTEELGIAQALDRAVAAGTNPLSLPSRLDALTAGDAQTALGSLTTDSPAAAQTWGIRAGQSVVKWLTPWLSDTTQERGTWRTWGSVFGHEGESGPKTDAANFDYDIKGVMAGADYALSETTHIGFVAAHTTGETFFSAGTATNDLHSTSIGLYAAQSWSALRVMAGGLIAAGRMRSTRANIPTDPLALVLGSPNAKTDTGGGSAFAQASYAIEQGAWTVSPTANLTYVRAKVGAINEAVSAGLLVDRATASSLRGDVGFRVSTITGPVRVNVGAAWSHDFNDPERTVTASVIGLPNSAFTIIGRAEKRGLLNAHAGVDIDIAPGWTGRLGWSGVLNDRLSGHTAQAGLSYRW